MSKTINLILTNNQAIHLWGMMVTYSHDTRNELINAKVFKKDGTPNKLRTNFDDITQEKLDNLALSELLYKYLEEQVNFSQEQS